MELLEDEDFEKAELYIEPPENGWLSDEDSGEEDAVVPDNMPRSVMLAPAEIEMAVGGSNTEDNEQSDLDENNQEVSPSYYKFIKALDKMICVT